MSYRYKQVEAALMETFGIEEEYRKAFSARLRHFRNLGVPDLPKVGKGTRNEYSTNDIYQLYITLELANCGMAPAIATDLTKKCFSLLVQYCDFVRFDTQKHPQFLAFSPSLIGDNFTVGERDIYYGFDRLALFDTERLIERHVKDQTHQRYRFIAINLSEGLHLLERALERQ